MMPEQNSRWHMPLFIRVTLLLHAAALALVITNSQLWKWALAAIILNHVLITIVGLWPRSHWLGPNWTNLPAASAARGEIALTIDDGPNPEVTPQVLELLDRHGIKATFFCIGEHAVKYPELCKAIVAHGHTIENHSQHHYHYFSVMGMRGLTQEIRAAQDAISAITGRRPEFFRAPAGLRNPFLDPVLAKLGLRLAAWTRRGFDTRTADAAVVCHRLMRDLKAGSILLLHDGNCARTPDGVPVILDVLPRLIEAGKSAGLRFVTLSQALELSYL